MSLRILAVLASGAAFVAAFPPSDVGGLAWVALVPLLLAAHRLTPPKAFWLGYAWGVVALGGVLWWITTFGAAVWLLGVLLLAVFPAVTLGAATWISGGEAGSFDALRFAVLWTAVEFFRSLGPLGFPWALLGESQHKALVVSQIASIVGVFGVSFLIALVNAVLAALTLRRHVVVPVAVGGVAVAATLLWGATALRAPAAAPREGAGFVTAVVQPGYETRLRWDAEKAARDLAALGRYTHEAASRGAGLVIWPETASPTDIPGEPATLAMLRSWVRRDHVTLIASSLEGRLTNSAFSFAPDGVPAGRYDKHRLVPFAEFGERAGRGPEILPGPRGEVGVAICFESTFPGLLRRAVVAGADLLAVITNDAWFDGTVAPAQHAAIAPFRAIEEGRYLLRAANSGPSMIIDPQGRVIAELPPGARGVLTARVVPLQGLTFYARYGHLFGWATVLAGMIMLLPRAVPFVVKQSGVPAFRRLIMGSLVPLAVLIAVLHLLPGGSTPPVYPRLVIPLPILAVLAATAILTPWRRGKDLGLGLAGFAPALLAGLAIVTGLGAMAFRGFSAHGTPPVLTPPPGGWVLGSAVQVLVVGLALEWWLRGLVFDAASAWRGWTAAVVWSALLGMAAAVPLGAEAMVWGVASGLAFGLIRARWPQVPALAVAHGVGNILLGFTLSSW